VRKPRTAVANNRDPQSRLPHPLPFTNFRSNPGEASVRSQFPKSIALAPMPRPYHFNHITRSFVGVRQPGLVVATNQYPQSRLPHPLPITNFRSNPGEASVRSQFPKSIALVPMPRPYHINHITVHVHFSSRPPPCQVARRGAATGHGFHKQPIPSIPVASPSSLYQFPLKPGRGIGSITISKIARSSPDAAPLPY